MVGIRHRAATSGPFGAFRVASGRVQAMTKEVAQRRGDNPSAVNAFFGKCQVKGVSCHRPERRTEEEPERQ
jgi:hypothetical protein